MDFLLFSVFPTRVFVFVLEVLVGMACPLASPTLPVHPRALSIAASFSFPDSVFGSAVVS